MPKYVALLRGIMPTNPKMSNANLRTLFENLGYANVQTVISSGNVIFESSSKDAPALETTIEKELPANLGFKSTTIIRSLEDLQKFLGKRPFQGIEDNPGFRLNVTFLKKSPKTNLRFPYKAEDNSFRLVALHDRAIFSVIDLTGGKTPDLMSWLEKQFGKEITTRTWKTVGRILKKME